MKASKAAQIKLTKAVASLPTALNLGSGDCDAFQYDANTDRMTQYQANINGQSIIGQLTWNANGTLGTLKITDPFNSGNTQTCGYVHDDLERIQSYNCGSVWAQTFSYDAFGNLSKSGSMSFLPTYSSSTNRLASLPGFTPSYDANGNVVNDSLHSYAWDAVGRPVTIDGVGVTYDALGRMVEQQNGTSYTEIAYAPWGLKLALMNGQSLTKAFVPLPGAATAVYTSTGTSTGLAYYRHSDWLSSSRVTSTPTRALYGDVAYAPFGEPYAQSGTSDLSFTGQNQDTVSALYDFQFREYGIQGRWPSPDPLGPGAFSLADPQSLNGYAYVRNTPTSLVDPLGLKCIPGCAGDPTWVGFSIGGGGGGFWLGIGLSDNGGSGGVWGEDPCNGDPTGCEVVSPWPIWPVVLLGFGAAGTAAVGDLSQSGPQSSSSQTPTDKKGVPCDTKILNTINAKFGTQFTTANINYNLSGIFNGAYNIVVSGSVATAAAFNALQPGRYSLSPALGYTLGGGDSLHIPGGGEPILINGVPTPTPFQNTNIGGSYTDTFTAHLDNGFAYNPFGFIFHELTDVAGKGSRDPCP